jgi:Tfp pilus assembly protein PilX
LPGLTAPASGAAIWAFDRAASGINAGRSRELSRLEPEGVGKMRQTISLLKNEAGGVVIIAAIMILALLTIIGIASLSTSNIEVRIAGQESVYQQNFYNAEGATLETVELLENTSNPKTAGLSWLELNVDGVTADEILDKSFWQSGNGTVAPQPSAALADTQFMAVSEGAVTGTSLAMGSTKVHAYTLYGRAAPPNRGETIIQIGYLKAFK